MPRTGGRSDSRQYPLYRKQTSQPGAGRKADDEPGSTFMAAPLGARGMARTAVLQDFKYTCVASRRWVAALMHAISRHAAFIGLSSLDVSLPPKILKLIQKVSYG